MDDDDKDKQGQFDFEAGKEGKKEGMDRVSEHAGPWFGKAVDWIRDNIPPGWEGKAEDFRVLIEVSHLGGAPGHKNVWGAVTGQASRRGFLEKTGAHKLARAQKSHACEVPVWRRTSKT